VTVFLEGVDQTYGFVHGLVVFNFLHVGSWVSIVEWLVGLVGQDGILMRGNCHDPCCWDLIFVLIEYVVEGLWLHLQRRKSSCWWYRKVLTF
jgi:hypothetical protein